MQPLRNLLDQVAPMFEKGGKLEKMYPAYEALDTFLSTLRIAFQTELPVTQDNFVKLGKSYDRGKLEKHGFKEEDKDAYA